MNELSKEHISIMQHTRDRAAGGYYCGTSVEMRELVALGLMQDAGRKSFVPDPYFSLTRYGRFALEQWESAQPKPKPVKRRRRSEAFREWYESGTRLNFSDFLKRRKQFA